MDNKRFPEPFKYCESYMEDFLKDADFKEVSMSGMRQTLQKLGVILSNIFQEVNYMTYDIEYFGWRGETAKNMHKIQSELVKRLLEMYVICKMALGADVYENSDVVENNDNL